MKVKLGTIMVAVLAAHFARAEILRFPDAPFEMPPALVGSRALWVKYDGFGFGGGDSHAGYAFLR